MNKIVILTGAGISAESGIKTFRDNNGLWENHDIYEVATPEAFKSNPNLVYEFYNQRRRQLLSDEVDFNQAHEALARLEKEYNGEVVLVTQNVDDLHERAGSKNVIHMHGELLKMFCIKTKTRYEIKKDLIHTTKCDCCKEEGNLRPDIVWFGEAVYNLDKIFDHLNSANIFISIGTSGNVYPASHFVQMVPAHCKKIQVNLESTDSSHAFDENLFGKASETLPELVNSIL